MVWKVKLQQSWAWFFFMMPFEFFPSLCYVLFVVLFLLPKDLHVFHCLYKRVDFLMSPWNAPEWNLLKTCFLSVVLPLTVQNPLTCSTSLSVPAFSSWDSLYFACLLSFSIWNMDSGEKFTTLLFQVANHSTIAFKRFFIFPYDLEKVSGRSKLLAKDNEKDSIFVKLIYK